MFGRLSTLSCDQNTLPFIKNYLKVCSFIHVPMAQKWITAVVLILKQMSKDRLGCDVKDSERWQKGRGLNRALA